MRFLWITLITIFTATWSLVKVVHLSTNKFLGLELSKFRSWEIWTSVNSKGTTGQILTWCPTNASTWLMLKTTRRITVATWLEWQWKTVLLSKAPAIWEGLCLLRKVADLVHKKANEVLHQNLLFMEMPETLLRDKAVANLTFQDPKNLLPPMVNNYQLKRSN